MNIPLLKYLYEGDSDIVSQINHLEWASSRVGIYLNVIKNYKDDLGNVVLDLDIDGSILSCLDSTLCQFAMARCVKRLLILNRVKL